MRLLADTKPTKNKIKHALAQLVSSPNQDVAAAPAAADNDDGTGRPKQKLQFMMLDDCRKMACALR